MKFNLISFSNDRGNCMVHLSFKLQFNNGIQKSTQRKCSYSAHHTGALRFVLTISQERIYLNKETNKTCSLEEIMK